MNDNNTEKDKMGQSNDNSMNIFFIAICVIMTFLLLSFLYQAWDTFANNNCIGMKYSSSLKPTPVDVHSCQDEVERWGAGILFLILPMFFVGGSIWYYFEKKRYNRDKAR